MELKFIKNAEDRVWIAEFEATADIALHIEGVVEKDVEIYQRGTASGQYALTKDGTPAVSYGKVYDYEIPILIAPKFIKVVCRTEPTYAEVVSNGEITELKYQEKSVEVTANGNTEVIPDAGFAGLTKVNVSVNVPQSGEGNSGGGEDSEGGSGGGGNIEYIDLTNASGAAAGIVLGCAYFLKAVITSDTMGEIKVSGMSATLIQEMAAGLGGKTSIIACAVDLTHRIKMSMGGQVQDLTVIEYGVGNGAKPEDFDALPRLTEEEFYNLNA